MTIETVGFVVHDGKPAALDLSRALQSWLDGRGLAVGEPSEGADLVVSLGGDGTMLRAAQAAHAIDSPLLGVNLGTLGYLTEVDAEGAEDALERVLEGHVEIEERMMLACSVVDAQGAAGPSFVGLNEALVERSARHRLVKLSVRIGAESLADFNADGVIVSTPTGSTAYALSAGGPIVSPRADCIVVVPVSAHIIFSRPFVLAGDETVEITVREEGRDASLTLDGSIGCSLDPGSAVTVRRHDRPLKLVRGFGPRFIDRLRTKLDLPG